MSNKKYLTTKQIQKEFGRPIVLKITMTEFKKRYCGVMLGSGCYRDVYELSLNPKWVVKVEANDMLANIMEWKIWTNVKYLSGSYEKIKNYFAKNLFLILKGEHSILIQERAKFKDVKYYPKKVPVFFTDIKTANFGWVGKRFVCIDYAACFDMAISLGFKNKYRKATWIKK